MYFLQPAGHSSFKLSYSRGVSNTKTHVYQLSIRLCIYSSVDTRTRIYETLRMSTQKHLVECVVIIGENVLPPYTDKHKKEEIAQALAGTYDMEKPPRQKIYYAKKEMVEARYEDTKCIFLPKVSTYKRNIQESKPKLEFDDDF